MNQAATAAITSTATVPAVRAFDVVVRNVRNLSPDFRRITFSGPSLHNFGIPGPTLDLRIKLLFPAAGGTVHLPAGPGGELGQGWYQQWLQLEQRGAMRTYTVRALRPGPDGPELDVDFVIHSDAAGHRGPGHGGPGSGWAAAAAPGATMTVIGPNAEAARCATAESYGGFEWRPGMARHVLLAGDETAVPAICSILESLPADVTGHALLEVPHAADFQDVRTESRVQVNWLARSGSTAVPHGQRLAEAVRRYVPVPAYASLPADPARPAQPVRPMEPTEVDIDSAILWETPQRLEAADVKQLRDPDRPPGALPFYAWIAGEAAVVRDLRRYLVRDVGIDRRQVAFMGYWRAGRSELA